VRQSPILTPFGCGTSTLPIQESRDGCGEMKGVDTIASIRREFFVQGKSIKEIVREQHVSGNTVRIPDHSASS
jgi:hypothetical protein